MSPQQTPPRHRWRSIGAVAAGFAVVFILSLGTDQALHALQVYPPWGVPMVDPSLLLLALAYRTVYGIAGSTLMARLAPHAPLRHAMIGGILGQAVSLAGVAATLAQPALGPLWYPVALAATPLPTAWIGAQIYLRRQAAA